MKLAVHQPNFFPWFPFFQKMAAADKFVILSDCQFEKNGYQNRFYLGGRWHTMSVNKGLESIWQKQYVSHAKDWNRIKANVGMCDLSEYDDCIGGSLLDTNRAVILKLRDALHITTPVMMDVPTGTSGTERLVRLCLLYGCDQYISGVSGKNYMDLSLFSKASIEVIFQKEAEMVKKHSLEVICA